MKNYWVYIAMLLVGTLSAGPIEHQAFTASLFDAIKNGDIEAARSAIKGGADLNANGYEGVVRDAIEVPYEPPIYVAWRQADLSMGSLIVKEAKARRVKLNLIDDLLSYEIAGADDAPHHAWVRLFLVAGANPNQEIDGLSLLAYSLKRKGHPAYSQCIAILREYGAK